MAISLAISTYIVSVVSQDKGAETRLDLGRLGSRDFWRDASLVKNDSLYAPLTQHENDIRGIGVNLALIHDPPLGVGAPPTGISGTYINVVESVEKNTPASKVFRPGDTILQVNDTVLDYGRELYLPEDVADMIHGAEGVR